MKLSVRRKHKGVSYAKWGYIFIAPFFLTYAVFTLVPQMLTNGGGTPNRTSMTLIMYLNNYLKTSKNYGMAGAISAIIFLITGAPSLVVYRSLTKQDD